MLRWFYRACDKLRHRARLRQWTADRASGRRGEDIAHRYLQRQGITIVGRNWQREEGGGEIDLIAWEKGVLVFVEVKARQTEEYGAPDRAIDRDKQETIIRAARTYARRARVPWEKVRFDVVGIVYGPPVSVKHVRDAFSGQLQ
jgi:putative endonuclease